MTMDIDIVFERSSMAVQRAWQLLKDSQPKLSGPRPELKYGVKSKPVSIADFESKVLPRLDSLMLDIGDSLLLFRTAAWNDIITINDVTADDQPSDKVYPFLAENSFLQAWFTNGEYYVQQNCEDPVMYRDDWPRENVQITWNPDIACERIDISQNPGRTLYRDGFAEVVAATMWFSPKMLDRLGVSEAQLSAESWLDVKRENGAIRIESYHKPFTSPDREEGERQDRLRELLYSNVPQT